MGRCLHEGVREGLPLDRQADRERKSEELGVTRLYNVNYFSIFHIETVEQPSWLPKSNMSVQTKWIYRFFTCMHKYCSPIDVEFY